jgi:protein involved in polysaccharide export with SLBB domain
VNGDHVEVEHREIPISSALAGDPDTDVVLKAGDVLTIRQLGGWSNIGGAMNVTGEVGHPGRYGIQDGERLSSILKRAGGFREDAYPYGAVLERAQVREIASKNRDELIRKLQNQIVDSPTQRETYSTTRQRNQLIERLKQIQVSGRVVINITPDIKAWENTPADVEVRAGDTLVIPKRPNFILVSGQVYSPTAITYSLGKTAGWYLKRAGGPTDLGNKKEVFVVRANGSVVGRTSGDFWSGGVLSTTLQPGDTVFVPERVSGPSKLALYSQAAQVISGVAIAAHLAGAF